MTADVPNADPRLSRESSGAELSVPRDATTKGPSMPDTGRAGAIRRFTSLDPTPIARWSVVGLAVLSMTLRPFVNGLGLPQALLNIDGLLTPCAVGMVALSAVIHWTSLPVAKRRLTVGMVVLVVLLLVSWALGTPHTWVGIALGGSMLLLLPLALYLVVMATGRPDSGYERSLIISLVLLQLTVGLAQYVARHVAQLAPEGADLVNGTTSHNFWPVFALPATVAILLSARDRKSLVWPIPVGLLAVYAEAKAALVIWAPLVIVTIIWCAYQMVNPETSRRLRDLRNQITVQRAGVAVTLGLVLVGLWWTPSVQGTFGVFAGHTRTLERFATTADKGDATQPTLADANKILRREMTESPRAFLFGLGPGNTTTHAAEILARGARSGLSLPPPGPVARELLSEEDVIKFRDAQSTDIGLWGDLGTVGAAGYLAFVGSAVLILCGASGGFRARVPRAWAITAMVLGLLAGGILLDWPEQATVVLPLALVICALARLPADDVPALPRAD